MIRKTVLASGGIFGLGTGLVVGLPLLLGFGAATACACVQRTADHLAKWEACATSRFESQHVENILPTTRFNAGKATSDEVAIGSWTEPVSHVRFEEFLTQEVNPHCGTFSDAKVADEKVAWWRDLYGYEALFIPQDPATLLAKAEV